MNADTLVVSSTIHDPRFTTEALPCYISRASNGSLKMKTFIFVVLFITLLCMAGQAQDHHRAEFFAGYSHGLVDDSTGRFFDTRGFTATGLQGFNGFEASGVYNVSRYVGIKGDLSGTYDRGNFSIPSGINGSFVGTANNSLYNVLGGVQFKDNSSARRLKPFAHLMVGIGHARTQVQVSCVPAGTCTEPFVFPDGSETGFAGAFGGGLDIRLSDRFDLRAFQLDYNPVKFDSGTIHNLRIGIGIVIK